MTKIVKSFSLLAILMAGILLGIYSLNNNSERGESPKSTSVEKSGLPTSYADYPSYDENSLITEADTIIIGEVIKTNDPEKINVKRGKNRDSKPTYFTYIVSDIKVHKVIKGNVKIGDIVKIKQMENEEGLDYFQKASRSMFFLKGFPDNVPYSTLNPFQGHIKIVNGKGQLHKDNKLFKDGISEEELITMVEEIAKKAK